LEGQCQQSLGHIKLVKLLAIQNTCKATAAHSPNLKVPDNWLDGDNPDSCSAVECLNRGDLLWSSGINQLPLY